jgi:hypothetical protein
MGYSLLKHALGGEVRVPFIFDSQQDAEGNSAPVAHVLPRLTAKKFRRVIDRLKEAAAHLKGDAAIDAEADRIFELWEEHIRRVEGYDEADALTGPELRAFFRGERLPEGLTEEQAEQARDTLRQHVKVAFNGWVNAHGPDYSFRRSS